MSKIYKDEIIPSKTEKVLIKRKCDLCGLEASTAEWDCGGWDISETHIEVSISLKEGETYPECGQETKYEVDLCPDCFKNKLIPWLKSQGATIEEEFREW